MPESLHNLPPGEIVRLLGERISQCSESTPLGGRAELISSGWPELDRLLPGGGFAPGTLVEWLGDFGSGVDALAVAAAQRASRGRGLVAVVDRRRTFYPPAAVGWGFDARQIVLIRPAREADEHWAIDQALRCPHLAAVLCWPERIDSRTYRRWQLAVKNSGTLGLVIRPSSARSEPSWATVRLSVEPRAGADVWRLHVELLRLRGGNRNQAVDLDLEPARTPASPATSENVAEAARVRARS